MRAELLRLAKPSVTLGNLDQFTITNQGQLLLDSYRGTTDWEEGATLEDAITEIQNTFNGEYGTFESSASGILTRADGLPVSAIYCSIFEEEPFVVFTFSEPNSLGKGFATKLIGAAAEVFRIQGFTTMHLFVTDVNPARHLYEKLGFSPIENG